VVHDNLLLYATGGLAYANVDHTLSDNCVGCGDPVTPVVPGDFTPISQSNDKTKVGWTVGGGAELLHDSHWVLRAEALYVDLGSETHTYVSAPINPLFPVAATSRAEWDDNFWVARLGVAYKFGGPDCCAAPLK
jgi:outer membrane immunogenic protein